MARTPEPDRPADQRGADWERRRRLAEVFGEVLPETTGDERDHAGGEGNGDRTDAWLRAEVPPHHGG